MNQLPSSRMSSALLAAASFLFAVPVAFAVPPAAPAAPDLIVPSDSGFSSSDDITNDTTPTITVSGCADGNELKLYSGAVLLTTDPTPVLCSNGSGALTVAAAAALATNGVYTLMATQTNDPEGASAASDPLNVTIDTGAPVAPGTPDLIAASDDGLSESDDLTSDTTPTFSVTCAANSAVQLLSGATVLATGPCSNGSGSLTSSALTNGVYTITAKQRDVAGNLSVASSGLEVTVSAVLATLAAGAQGGPNDGQQGVPVDARIDRVFLGSGGSDSTITLSGATVTLSTVSLKANTGNLEEGAPSGPNLCTSLSIDFFRNIVCNHAPLEPELWYTLTLSGGLNGIKSQTPSIQTLATSRTYAFRTGGFQGGGNFLPPPSILGGVPRPGSVVPINAKLRVYFNVGGTGSTTMKTSGLNSVLNTQNVFIAEVVNGEPQELNLLACEGGANCNMSWNATGNELIVTPGWQAPGGSVAYNATGALVPGNKYLFVVESGGGPGGAPGIQNTADGNLMGQPFFTMFTATGADSIGPTVRAVYPSSGSTLVDRATYDISIGFSEAIDPATVTGGSILFYRETAGAGFSAAQDTLVTGTYVSYTSKDNTAHLSPSALLDDTVKYYIVVTTNIKDISGNALQYQTVRAFTTTDQINGGGTSDGTAPRITGVNADNFSIAVTFSEAMLFDASVNKAKTSSDSMDAVNNARNWKLAMTPEGFTYDLSANGRTITYDPPSRTLIFGGLMMPPGQGFVMQASTSSGVVRVKDLSSNLLSPSTATGSVRSMDETMGMMIPGQEGGDFNFFQNGLRPKMVMPMTPVAGATTNYDVMFATSRVLPLGGTITLTFPTGFSTAGTCSTKASIPLNDDINGPGTGTVGIASIACNNVDRSVTVTTNLAATQAEDMLHFVVQGIVNTPVPTSPGAEGYRISMQTKSTTGALLESVTSMPISIGQGGSRSIGGTVFNDNGAGGTAGDQIKHEDEPGVANIKVCMSGPGTNNCTLTDVNGVYSFTSLNDGFYNVMLPPLTTDTQLFVGGSSFRDARVSGGNISGLDFGLSSSSQTITVSITGIPADTDIDVFAFNPNSNKSGNVVRELNYDGASRTVDLPVATGTWNVGLGPKMNKDPSMGGNASQMDFTFMPPAPKNVIVPSGGNATVSFSLTPAAQQIKGSVVNAAGTAVNNAFVMARPATASDEGPGKEGMGQSKADGTFSVFVASGTYVVQAMKPGMPPSTSVPVLVKPDTDEGATDGNSAADVYANGSLVTAGNPLTLTILQGGLSIAGQVLDDTGNAIPYAHVMAKKKTDGSFGGTFRDAPADSAGNYTIYVDAGTWDLTAFVPGFGELPSTTVVITSNSVTGQNLQVSAGNFGTVSGTVTQGVGETAVAGAFVNIYGTNGGNHTATAADGTYSVKVRAGTYTIDGFLPGTGPTTSTGVTVPAGGTVSGRNLRIGGGATIRVTIPGITDAFVRAEDTNGKGNGTNSATSTGVYVLTVAAGTYTIRAQNLSLGVIGSQAVTVAAGETSSITFTPSAAYAVSGTISSSSTTCTLGATVAFSDATTGRTKVVPATDAGTYSVNLPNGTYRITAGNAGCVDSAAPSTVTVNGAAVSTGTNRTLSPSTATISGRVTLGGAAITLPTKVFARNSDNKFTFTDVNSGSYVLRVTSGDWIIMARSDGYVSAETTVAAGGTQNLALTAISGYTRFEPLTTEVTPTAGGVVKNSTIGDRFSLTLPAGAMGTSSNASPIITAPTSAFVTQTATAQTIGSTAVEVTPKDENGKTKSSLDVPGTITIPVASADLLAAGVTDITKLTLATWNDSSGWVPMETTVDATNNTLTAPVQHFSVIAPIVPRGGGSTPAATPAPATTTTTTTTTPSGGGGGGSRGRLGLPLPPDVVTTTLNAAAPAIPAVQGFLSVTVEGKKTLFRDVPLQQWFAPYIDTIISAGIASGYRNTQGKLTGEFGPGNSVTYAEIAKMALQSSGKPVASSTTGLKNRSARNHWSARYIREAESRSLSVFGNRLNVKLPATRGAVMQTLVEALNITEQPAATPTALSASGSGTTATGTGALSGTGSGLESPAASPAISSPSVTFSDLKDTHQNAAAIKLLATLGVISGDTDGSGRLTGKVRPNASINRAEVAKIISKLIELKYIH
ncbi:MAG: carboxypeptidase regulatory-like domain-containing protein [Candidatus Peribacteraceae bacterium]|nr:carboxypeptidase regulatory-like domain-containing protein [Candidatus Peribacteraceae bacterium]